MKRIFGADQETDQPVVLLELDEEDLAVLRAGEPLRVELASTLSCWKPVLEPGERWAVNAVLSLTPGARLRVLDPRSRVLSDDEYQTIVAGLEGQWVVGASGEGVIDLSTPGDDTDDAQVEALRRDLVRIAAAWATVVGAVTPALESFWASVLSAANTLAAAGVDLTDLAQAGPDLGHCNCLCPLHRKDGMFCEGDAVVTVTLVGGLPDGQATAVPMCVSCMAWWRIERPHRVESWQEPGGPVCFDQPASSG